MNTHECTVPTFVLFLDFSIVDQMIYALVRGQLISTFRYFEKDTLVHILLTQASYDIMSMCEDYEKCTG